METDRFGQHAAFDIAALADKRVGRIGMADALGILVDDLDATEQKILAAGYRTHSHQTYDPGSRFYFHDHDDIEWEVVSYA